MTQFLNPVLETRNNFGQSSGNLHHHGKVPVGATSFSRKLAGFAALTEREFALLDEASSPARLVPANHDLIAEGDKPGPTFVVLDG